MECGKEHCNHVHFHDNGASRTLRWSPTHSLCGASLPLTATKMATCCATMVMFSQRPPTPLPLYSHQLILWANCQKLNSWMPKKRSSVTHSWLFKSGTPWQCWYKTNSLSSSSGSLLVASTWDKYSTAAALSFPESPSQPEAVSCGGQP